MGRGGEGRQIPGKFRKKYNFLVRIEKIILKNTCVAFSIKKGMRKKLIAKRELFSPAARKPF